MTALPTSYNAPPSHWGLARHWGRGRISPRGIVIFALLKSIASISSTTKLDEFPLFVITSAKIQSSPFLAATLSPGKTRYPLSGGIEPHRGGGFSFGPPIHSGVVRAIILGFYLLKYFICSFFLQKL